MERKPGAAVKAIRVSNREERALRAPKGAEAARQGIGEPELPPLAPKAATEAILVPGRRPILPAWVASYTNPGTITLMRKALTSSQGPEAAPEDSPIGETRQRVSDTTQFPWRCLCRLDIQAVDGSLWLGTGWFASPTVVVTAGHCVYLKDAGGWASRITVSPAYNEGPSQFGSVDADNFHTTDLYVQGQKDDPITHVNDYAAIILPQAFSLGFFGYGVFSDDELSGAQVNVYGYPQDKNEGSGLWGDTRNLYKLNDKQVFYQLATYGGQSGCPVFIKQGDDRTAVGIHNYGGDPANFATRITDDVFNDIEAWKGGAD
jgi:V8-like Glu-specific endopeptidase